MSAATTGLRRLAAASIVVTSAGLGSCTQPPTALVLAVSTDADVPAEVSQLEILVTRPHGRFAGTTTEVRFDRTYRLGDDARLPGTLTLQNGDAEEPSVPLTIVVVGGTSGGPRIRREARLGMIDRTTKLLRLRLDKACLAVSCEPDLTCVQGACVPPDVDPSTLPDYSAAEGPGEVGAAGAGAGGSAAAGGGGAGGAGGGGTAKSGAGWPMFQHDPQHTGRSDVNGPASLPTKKQLSFSQSWGPAVVGADATVYFQSQGLVAVAPTGAAKWSFPVANAILGATPALDGMGAVYAGDATTTMFALGAADGTKHWETSALPKGIATPVTVAPDGTVHFAHGGTMFALGADGASKWSVSAGSLVVGHAVAPDGTVYVSSDNGTPDFVALAPDGNQKWTLAAEDGVWTHPTVGPDGAVYFQTATSLYAVSPAGKVAWTAPLPAPSMAGTASTPGPVIAADGTIVVATGEVVAAFAPSGDQKWVRSFAGETFAGAAMGLDGTTYAVAARFSSGTPTGSLRAIALDGTVRWAVLDGLPALIVPPAIGPDGTLYVGTPSLYAFSPLRVTPSRPSTTRAARGPSRRGA
jgi:outer membrane protein assembly factor BamB